MDTPTPISSWPARIAGAVSGLVTAIVALGIAELVAGTRSSWRSPVFDVGDRVVDNVPGWLKDLAIEWFGTRDKQVLVGSILAILGVYAMVIGALAFSRRFVIGIAGVGLFGLVGMFMAFTRNVGGGVLAMIPTVVGVAAGMGALLIGFVVIVPSLVLDTDADDIDPGRDDHDSELVDTTTDVGIDNRSAETTRREVLVKSGAVLGGMAVVGAGAGAVGRAIRPSAEASRRTAAEGLPVPARPLSPIADAVSVDVPGMSSFVTANEDFYRIDTALEVPQVPTDGYTLTVKGMVDQELQISYEDLINREVVEYDITMTCVSNVVGGELVGNARWLGVRLDTLLEEAGIQAGANQVVGRSIDGYTCGFPVEAAMDGRNAIVAFGMNGEPLPVEHGFPVRLVVPGLYGYISATKWLTEIEVTTFEDFEQYWVPRGYADRAPINLMSRIDSIDGLDRLDIDENGMAAVGGVAWAQTRGISAVEVSLDDGDWQPAELGEALNDDTWRQWAFRFQVPDPDASRLSIKCRAIDGDGLIQTDERVEPLPAGASGHHSIVALIG
jgi:DMSO/TMAO reductase YedYZ molybdopterin-dependent catalytic subunit